MDLEQDAKWSLRGRSSLPRAIEALGERLIIDRIYRMKNRGGACRLVALQMADQMPPRVGMIGMRLALPFPFLDAVFADVAKAGVICCSIFFRGVRFLDADQRIFRRAAAGTRRSRRDTIANARDVVAEKVWTGHGRGRHSADEEAWPLRSGLSKIPCEASTLTLGRFCGWR